MKNIAYFGWSGSPDKDANELFYDCVRSLKSVTDVDVYVTTFPNTLSPEIEEIVTPIYVSHQQWDNRRLTAKLEKMLEIPMNDGDKFCYFDGDLYFRHDPFKAFEDQPDLDVFYTERHYNFEFPVNGGVWGFKVSSDTQKFRKWFVTEVQNPTWEPYVYLRKNHPYVKEFDHKDWWVDQDFLNCIHWRKEWVNHELGTNLKIVNLGPRYNLIVNKENVDSMVEEYDPILLHFKNAQGYKRWQKGVTS